MSEETRTFLYEEGGVDKATGYLIVIRRWPRFAWFMKEYFTGYVCLPKGHPYFGKDYHDMDHIPAHGGLTFSEQVDDLWWIGFDIAHGWEDESMQRIEYVRDRCQSLALALRA